MSAVDLVTLLSSTPAAEGAETMKFYLTYEGRLLATQGDARENQRDRRADYKHAIRRVWHAQLKQLWQTSKFLREQKSWRSDWDPSATPSDTREPLCEIIADLYVRDGFRFLPLVREQWYLHCSLDVLLLRRDTLGHSGVTAGDLDNRLKTIIDTLRVPKGRNESEGLAPTSEEDPFYCLLEEDSLISEFHLRSGPLLEPKTADNSDASWAKVIIAVTITPFHGTVFNSMFDHD